MKNVIKIKNLLFKKKYIYTKYEKNLSYKIVHLLKIYKFTSDCFLIGHVVFDLIVKKTKYFFENFVHMIEYDKERLSYLVT